MSTMTEKVLADPEGTLYKYQLESSQTQLRHPKTGDFWPVVRTKTGLRIQDNDERESDWNFESSSMFWVDKKLFYLQPHEVGLYQEVLKVKPITPKEPSICPVCNKEDFNASN